ncbi:MAG TPA: electron transport complex subunit RsxB [Rubrivivax sp.]|nr:electron transport complex subunit RsxB [Pseudomonadota bacterium]HOW47652.1 electron transport complex subunit RsxB [Rubrivivax sp.]HRY87604.1 electron transport complex subunit RsxB [Rubrivivax sp.]
MSRLAAPDAAAIDAALPQTQCTRCGWADCRSYAEAIAAGEAPINRCAPGGAEGVERLAAITGRPALPLDAAHGCEGPRLLAVIDESGCIGCTLCIQACPVDCIVGAPKRMHTVIAELCTGCELCVAPCPVDCIALVPATGTRTGWAAWSAAQADTARERYALHRLRAERERRVHDERLAASARTKLAELAAQAPPAPTGAPLPDRAAIDAAVARARKQRAALADAGRGTP